MTHTGKCYCGDIRFEFEDPIQSQLLCHCRECRYLSGGEANASIVILEETFRVTKGELKTFSRRDLETPRIRYFCGNCGTHICVKSPPRPGMLVLKIGTWTITLGLVRRQQFIALINSRITSYPKMFQVLRKHRRPSDNIHWRRNYF